MGIGIVIGNIVDGHDSHGSTVSMKVKSIRDTIVLSDDITTQVDFTIEKSDAITIADNIDTELNAP